MEPFLDKLLSNNDPPTEKAIHEVKAYLVTPLQELAETNSEISKLEERLKSLAEKRDSIQISTNRYIAILSPIRRLPPDILHEVFYHCLSTHRDPIMTASEAPMLLTHVCSSWRTVALSSPRLWAQLHITFCDNYRVRDPWDMDGPEFADAYGPFDEAIRSRAEKTLQIRCDSVKEWLGRSGTCPLSISLHYSSVMRGRSEMESIGPLTLALFRNLLLFKQRWREMELWIPLELYRKFEAMVSVDALPMLSVFKGHFIERIHRSPSEQLDPIALLRAPNLERVSLAGGTSRLWRLDDAQLVSAWTEKLTYLCFHYPLKVVELFSLLKLCPNLEHCKFDVTDAMDAPGHHPDYSALQGLVPLPRLQSLWIVEDITGPAPMSLFYDHIDAPSLTWVNYQKYIHGWYQGEITNPAFTPPIFSLLAKSSRLKKLTVDPKRMSPWNMRRILELGGHLTHLVIGNEPVGPSRTLSHDDLEPSTGGPATGQETFLDLLTVGDSDPASPSDAVIKKDVLLPSMEVLEISAPHSYNISDEQLLRFITSRAGSYSENGVAPLKVVRVVFNRVKEMDVAEETAQFWRAQGIESGVVRLELEYLSEPRSEYPDQLSPSFGLAEDGRSWPYPDI